MARKLTVVLSQAPGKHPAKRGLEESVAARYGAGYVPTPDEMDEVAALIRDYRDLGVVVVTHLLDEALQRRIVSAASDYTAGIVARGDWKPARS